jgi:hypothetical protein
LSKLCCQELLDVYYPNLEWQVVDHDVPPAAMEEYYQQTGVLLVSGINNNNPIWVDNAAFRAWHDVTHICFGFGYDLVGEMQTAEQQIQQAEAIQMGNYFLRMLRADTIGQQLFHHMKGIFPVNQTSFNEEYIRGTKI